MVNYFLFALLILFGCYIFLVNRKLNKVKIFIDEFHSSFYHFNNSVDKITHYIADFKDMNKYSVIDLEQKITQTMLLINELQIINDDTTQQIEILEKKLRSLKNISRPNPAHTEKHSFYKMHEEHGEDNTSTNRVKPLDSSKSKETIFNINQIKTS